MAWKRSSTVGTLVGLAIETTGDLQLARFKRDPANRGRVMGRGLWRYSRHPNYFGEAVVWWGFFLVVLPSPNAAWAVIGPITITFLLVRVSGVRMLEKGMIERKPGYADYVRKTSAFIPWPPRRIWGIRDLEAASILGCEDAQLWSRFERADLSGNQGQKNPGVDAAGSESDG